MSEINAHVTFLLDYWWDWHRPIPWLDQRGPEPQGANPPKPQVHTVHTLY